MNVQKSNVQGLSAQESSVQEPNAQALSAQEFSAQVLNNQTWNVQALNAQALNVTLSVIFSRTYRWSSEDYAEFAMNSLQALERVMRLTFDRLKTSVGYQGCLGVFLTASQRYYFLDLCLNFEARVRSNPCYLLTYIGALDLAVLTITKYYLMMCTIAVKYPALVAEVNELFARAAAWLSEVNATIRSEGVA
jgi:hypothetical protein